jgi:CheY-like chemotaxis protein
MKVLIADDSRPVRKMIALMVSELRPYVDEVMEAEDATGLRRAAAAVGRELAVVVADWDLPGLPGARIAEELRGICGGRDVAVLACINAGQEAELAKAGPMAVRDHVVRPFSQDDLRRKLLAILAQSPEAVAEASAVLKTIVASTSGEADLPFFLQLPSAVMKDFLELCSSSKVPAGTVIFPAGRPVNALHVVSSGSVELAPADGKGAPEAVDAGNCFGEICFMSGGPSAVTARAKTRAEILALDRGGLAELLRRQPRMSQYLGVLAARRAGSAPARPAPAATSGVGGNLRSMPFSDLVQMLHSTGKSGELQLEEKDGRGGLSFEEGILLHAWSGEQAGTDAFFALAGWKEGMFYFKAGAPARGRTISEPTMTLLLEAMRRVDEAGRPAPASPPPDASLDELFGEGPSKSSAPPPELFGDEAPRKSEPPPDF